MNDGELALNTVERHYRVTLDFRLRARDITPEVCQEGFFFKDGNVSEGETHSQENMERQRRLYHILLNNREILEQYLLSVITQEAGQFAYEGLPDAFDAREEEELLIPLYRSMSEEDARFFEECREMGALSENTELIATAFRVDWEAAELAEMSRTVSGDVKRAEVVEQTKTRLIRKMNSP